MAGLFGALASGLRRREIKATDAGSLSWAGLFGQHNSRAGVAVNVDSALKVSTVFACLRVLADGIAQVPLKVYREKADGTKELARDHPAYRLLSRRPNEWMTSFEFRQVMMFHAALLGNGCAWIGRIRGVPRELIPLVPGSYSIEQARDYTLTYRLTGPTGQSTVLPREDVFHLRGPSWTGAAGLDALQVAREAVGLAIATEETHSALHANGTQPGGVLSVKGALDDAARARLKESWAQYQGGLANRFKTAVLDMDSTWTPLGMKGVDAEHLDTRRFQIEEICRDLKVFPQMVGYGAPMTAALVFLQGNWRWLAPMAALLAIGTWGGWQYLGRLEAEQAIVEMMTRQLEDANATWAELNAKREDFEREVRQGFERLSIEIGKARADNAAYAAKVSNNANSKRPLDPVERDALGMLGNVRSDPASRRAAQPATQSPPVR
jgi:HK97 family phage portal protein